MAGPHLSVRPRQWPWSWTGGRIDGALAGSVFLLALAVYVATAARSVTWEHSGADGGDLLSAAAVWGVPHPTGYPTYILALRAFSWVVPIGELAFRGSLMSAVLGAAAVGLLYLALVRVLRTLPEAARLPEIAVRGAALVAALAFAFCREFWSQANIAEVYALNALFFALLLLILLSARSRRAEGRSDAVLRVCGGLLLGIGLGNHLTLGLAIAPFVVWAMLTPRRGASRWRLWLDWRPIAAFCAGLAVYAYAPLASAREPALNWGHPHTAQGFWWMISGSIYQGYAFSLEGSHLPGRLASWAGFFLAQYSAVGLLIGVVGVTVLWERRRGFLLAGAASVALVSLYTIGYETRDSFIYLIVPFMVFAMWIGAGLINLLETVRGVLSRLSAGRPWMRPAAFAAVFLVALLALPGFSAFANAADMNLNRPSEAADFAEDVFRTAGPGSVVLVWTDEQLFPLWYRAYVLEPDADVLVVSMTHLQFDWYWDDLRRQAADRVPSIPRTGFDDRLLAMVEHSLGVRPVYVTFEYEPFGRRFLLAPEGNIFRIE